MRTSPNIDILRGVSQSRIISEMVFISILLHVVGLSTIFLLPNLSSRTYYSPVYSVRLVNLTPAPVSPARSSPALPSPKPPASEEQSRAKEKAKPITLNPPKTEDSEKKIDEAIERIRQRQQAKNLKGKIEQMRNESESRQVDSAIERMRSESEARQVNSAIEGIRKRATISSKGAVEADEVGVTSGASSGVMSIKFKLYYNMIWQRIHSVWVLPEEALGGKKNLETIIAIRIDRNGNIVEIQFEKKSGNPYLDESALRAIKKANPLPPLPAGIEEDKFDVGIRFTPSDL